MVYSEGRVWVEGSSHPSTVTIMPISSVETRTKISILYFCRNCSAVRVHATFWEDLILFPGPRSGGSAPPVTIGPETWRLTPSYMSHGDKNCLSLLNYLVAFSVISVLPHAIRICCYTIWICYYFIFLNNLTLHYTIGFSPYVYIRKFHFDYYPKAPSFIL